ncbi:MAG: trypsin-like peptidase domain-containing protein [Candidatus Omnitrophica bacterium]|nr:trypsin-like peptidase domain-containing protein [Candidatus Omnitrophota bacterium]
MKNRFALLVSLTLVFSASGFEALAQDTLDLGATYDPKVIYGEDDRLDYYQVDDPSLRMLADSTAIMVQLSGVADTGNGFRFTSRETLSDNNVCPEEPFYDQPTPGFCSAFLVAPNLVATAGHCVSSLNVTNMAFVFGFQMLDGKTPVTEFDYEDVYFGAELFAKQGSTCTNDWALIRLDRPVEGRAPLAVRREGKVPDNQDLVVIGYPVGLPVKISGGAKVRSNTGFRIFVANLDTYQGNSGSAVFNADTLEVEGILVCGETDFVLDSSQGCRVSNRCPDNGCRGEDCTRATEWSGMIPVDPCEKEGALAFVSPSQSQAYPRGEELEIQWTSTGAVGGSLDLLLFSGDFYTGQSWSPLGNVCGATNSATIELPADLPLGSNYRFRIHNRGVGDSFVSAFSPYFSVTKNSKEEMAKIEILSPTSSSSGIVGGLQEIRWTSTGNAGEEIRLLLFRGEPESLAWQFVDLHVANHEGENSYLWTVPLGLEEASDYRIRLLSTGAEAVDLSDAFSIVEPESIRVAQPDRWTRGLVGQELEVRWESDAGAASTVDLLVFAGQAPVWQGVRIADIPNIVGENVYRWRIPQDWTATVQPGVPFYSIKIFQDAARNDFSDLFSIDRVPTSIEFESPIQTQAWRVGEQVDIRWTSMGEVRPNLQLLLFQDLGGVLHWQWIAEPVPNQNGENTYVWTIPTGLSPSENYVLKIYDPLDESLFDLSERFSILSAKSEKGKWGPEELIEYLKERRIGGAKRDQGLPLLWNP